MNRFDTLLCSLPKSGRTMLRYLLATYFNQVGQLGLEHDLNLGLIVIPNFVVKERANHHYTPEDIFAVATLLHDRQLPLMRACHFNPNDSIGEASVILLLRSPFDVIVSRYHEQKYRPGVGRSPFDGTLSDYLTQTQMLDTQTRHFNSWAEWGAAHPQRFWVTTYEQLMADKRGAAAAILTFLSLPVDEDALAIALDESSFEAMQQQAIENLGEVWKEKGENPSVLRVRRGKVGGYVDDMTPSDIERVNNYFEAHLTEVAKQLLTTHHIPFQG